MKTIKMENKTTHTPGSNGLTLINRKALDGTISVDILCQDFSGIGIVGFKPSAILALPELLRALKYAEEWLREDVWMQADTKYVASMMKKAAVIARAALDKAEGGK